MIPIDSKKFVSICKNLYEFVWICVNWYKISGLIVYFYFYKLFKFIMHCLIIKILQFYK